MLLGGLLGVKEATGQKAAVPSTLGGTVAFPELRQAVEGAREPAPAVVTAQASGSGFP